MPYWKLVLLLTVVVWCASFCQCQLILTKHNQCSYSENFTIESDFIQINSKLSATKIAISPCRQFRELPDVPAEFKNCKQNSKTCVLDIRSNKYINAGNIFSYETCPDTEDYGDSSEKCLVSSGGDTCNNGNYKVVIHFHCTENILPTLTTITDICTYHVHILSSTCNPTCTIRVDGHLVNLRPLTTSKLVVVGISTGETSPLYHLSLCGRLAANVCRNSPANVACRVDRIGNNDTTTILGILETQHVLYEESRGQIFIRAHSGGKKRQRKYVEITLVCNWKIDNVANPKFIKHRANTDYFEVETKLGCIKRYTSCVVSGHDNLSYNLESLYKADSNWVVVDKTRRKSINLNICGQLDKIPNNLCKKSHSQICDLQTQLNYGSIMRPLEVESYGEFITANFIGGSTCLANNNLTYSTNIKLICSLKTSSPIITTENDCSLDILWETIAACPRYISTGYDCAVNNFGGSRLYLKELHTNEDRVISITPKKSLRFNLCGTLNTPCNNYNNVTICLIGENRVETVLGWNNSLVTIDNGLIKSEFNGSKCSGNQNSNITVEFRCNFNQTKEGFVQINTLQDKCKYSMTVDTPLACNSNSNHSCMLETNGEVYDLTPLRKDNNNYVIKSTNITYYINICRPIINKPNMICPPNSLACLLNVTLSNIKDRFSSLGTSQNLYLQQKGGLTMQFIQGEFCLGSKSLAKESVIYFNCSNNQESGPILIKTTKCEHTFVWHTKYACPRKIIKRKRSEIECLINFVNGTNLYNLTLFPKKTVNIRLDDKNTTFEINICQEDYFIIKNNVSNKETAIRTLHQLDDGYILQYEIIDKQFINIKFSCIETDKEDIELQDKTENHINLELKSSILCEKVVTKNEKSANEALYKDEITSTTTTTTKISKHKTKTVEETTKVVETIVKQNCFVVSHEETFLLNKLLAFEIISEKGNKYFINFNESTDCSGYVCKNNFVFGKPSMDCPNYNVYENRGEIIVQFALDNLENCQNKKTGIDVLIECSSAENIFITQENNCYVSITYETSLLCSFIRSNILPIKSPETDHTNISSILGITLSVLLLISIAAAILYYVIIKKRRSEYRREFVSLNYKGD